MKNAAYIILAILISHLVACTTPNEETSLRETLRELVTAVEDRSVRRVQKYLTDDFKTARHSNTQQLKAFMLLHFRQNQVINVFTNEVQVNLLQEKADITFNALVTGSSNWLPERGRRFAVQSRWLKQEGNWKISRVNWEEVTGFN